MYIDKYRVFKNQKIQFSNKFFVDYDEKLKTLSIEKNMNHIDLYPNNIVNISGILGRNASGKTSLLSLIGSKIKERHDRNEIFVEEVEDPHKKIIFTKGSTDIEKIQYTSSYFLVYYTEVDNKTVFVFETNTPQKYISLFENFDEWTRKIPVYGPKLNYFIGKGWFAAAFKCENKKNILINDIQKYPIDKSIQNESTIICFKKDTYKHKFDVTMSNDEEMKIAIKRKTVPMQSILLKTQLNFLVKQMNLESAQKQMYNNDRYVINIVFADYIPSLISKEFELKFDSNKIIEDYRDFAIDKLHDWEKITLAFLNQYTLFLLQIQENMNRVFKEEEIATDLYEISRNYTPSTYLEIKELYHKKIDFLLKLILNEYITLTDLKKCEDALELFLQNASKWGFKYVYKRNSNLIIELSKESDIAAAEVFFENFLDEDMHKNLEHEDSVLGGFLKIDIQWLSDGEKENLALFSSIDEQIVLNSRRDKYILVFDEIERAMHPDLCRCLIFELIDFLKQYRKKEFQIIIASHSPFIVGDLLKENIVCLKRDSDSSEVHVIQEKPFAQNIHTILKSQFFLNSFLGEYASKCIELFIKCLKIDDIEEVKKEINIFLDCSSADVNKKIIISNEEAKKFLQGILQSIGEPLISRELARRFSKKDWWQVDEKIEYYKRKLAELEGQVHD